MRRFGSVTLEDLHIKSMTATPSPGSNLLHLLYDISYNRFMYTILRSATFDQWLNRLRDRQAVSRIVARLLAAEDGHLGDVRSVGGGVSEMRI